jgi:hypothetical protein
MTALSLGMRLVILGLNAYLLYGWFKRDRHLDRMAWQVRIVTILAGVLFFAVALHIETYQNQEGVLRYMVLPAAFVIVVFLFFADASYFLTQALKRVTGNRGSSADVPPRLTVIDRSSIAARSAGIGLGLSLCLDALYMGNFQNQVSLNRFLLIPGAGVAVLFAFVPAVPDYLSRVVRRWVDRS